MRKKITSIFILIILFTSSINFIFTHPVKASDAPFDVVSTFAVNDQEATDGDILISSSQGLTRANSEASSQLFGVLQLNPLIVYKSQNDSNKPVARTGVVKVNVTTLTGPIQKGDLITSSIILGKGEKALHSGYVLGVALEDFNNNDGNKITYGNKQIATGQISVAIKIEYAEIDTARSLNRLLEYINSAIFQNLQTPQQAIKIMQYFFAALIVLAGFTISFLTFSRAITKGIEAIGRNPSARQSIQFSMAINTILTVIITVLAIVASIIIIRF